MSQTSVGPEMAQRQNAVPAYSTDRGRMYQATFEQFTESLEFEELRGNVQLVLTSPPFPLNRKKKYGNHEGEQYLEWIKALTPKIIDLLTADGSFVVEIGNSWEPGRPTMSTLSLRTLLGILEAGGLSLCQQFVWHNPARLPSPAQWVTVERTRVKDAFTNIWWMAKTDRPKANNRNVLTDYSEAMQKLLTKGSYNSGPRPSEHSISPTSFLTNNGGAIPSNVLTLANTIARDDYQLYCREHGIVFHPARMPTKLAEFFIRFLTDDDDIVFDPFGGSNTTGAAAEQTGRRWVATEPVSNYVEGSRGRFSSILDKADR